MEIGQLEDEYNFLTVTVHVLIGIVVTISGSVFLLNCQETSKR